MSEFIEYLLQKKKTLRVTCCDLNLKFRISGFILTLLAMVVPLDRFPKADAATSIAHTSHVRESNYPGRHAK